MIKILANDGIDKAGEEMLIRAGFKVDKNKIKQEDLAAVINQEKYNAILVRSATQVRQDIINNCKTIQVIGRAGTGLDNIDIECAKQKGIAVINTPRAPAQSVAELVFAHLFTGARNLHKTNRKMPQGIDFKILKKESGKGMELAGKTIGIWGFGRIGQEVAKKALALGMNILPYDPFVFEAILNIEIPAVKRNFKEKIKTVSQNKILTQSDIITFHVPKPKTGPLITEKEISKMKDGVFIINTARGGILEEESLIEALKTNKIAFAGLDVFVNEPTPKPELLSMPNVSISPHIGGSTKEAQERIGRELASKVINYFLNKKNI